MMKASKLIGVFMIFVVVATVSLAQHDESGEGGSQPESEHESSVPLNPAAGEEIGFVYQAFLSPEQEAGEEADTPPFIPEVFQSTEPSTPREERLSRGHAVIEFTNDLSKAYVHLAIENVDVESINLLHLHCGRPGMLGPIIVDFHNSGDFNEYLADGVMTIEIRNADLEMVLESSEGLVGAFTGGCPIIEGNPVDRVRTIGGLEFVARQGELYFNLHTTSQTYFGDIRGAFYAVDMDG